MLLFLILLIGAALFLAGWKATRAAYESAPYKLVRSDGSFELRDYPALTVVETTVTRIGDDADKSFRRLFGFITGRNEAKQKISMTTPVFMSGGDSNMTMAFVLPAKLGSGQAPRPSDDSLKLRELAAGRFAVLRYSGERNAKREAEALGRLKTWMVAEGLNILSPPVYGYFDPPWTPAFLRRNEVMLRTPAGQ
jgi:hypothetical protein